MSKPVKPIPDGYTALTPYLTIKDAGEALDFYKKVFDAKEVMRLNGPDGKVMHAEIRIGGAALMLSEEAPQWNALSPQTIGGTGTCVVLYVTDADSVVDRAVKAGAKLVMPVADQFYGDRSGGVIDPFGHKWNIATHIEDVSEEEMNRRAAKMFEKP